jgi:hypothetical protein
VENVCEALDSPGQWYLDRPSGTLYYLPRPGEEMSSAEIIAPSLAQVVRVAGRPGEPVHDIRFEPLAFAHTEWQPPADYASSLQAGIEVPGAIQFEYAERCAVVGSRIEHIGNYGIEVGAGCTDLEFSHNRIMDIGAGGIRTGHFFSWETDDSGQLTERGLQRKAAMPKGPHSRRITVADNEIAHCGRFTPEAVGVFVGDNADNQILHNLYWNVSGQPVLCFGKSFSAWQATGQDKNSLIADPLLTGPAHGDFRLRPGSPLARIGFQPWDLAAVGPRLRSGAPDH